MINEKTVIWADYGFIEESGIAKNGADIYLTFIRCHPSNLKQLLEGIKINMGFDLDVVYDRPGQPVIGEIH